MENQQQYENDKMHLTLQDLENLQSGLEEGRLNFKS